MVIYQALTVIDLMHPRPQTPFCIQAILQLLESGSGNLFSIMAPFPRVADKPDRQELAVTFRAVLASCCRLVFSPHIANT